MFFRCLPVFGHFLVHRIYLSDFYVKHKFLFGRDALLKPLIEFEIKSRIKICPPIIFKVEIPSSLFTRCTQILFQILGTLYQFLHALGHCLQHLAVLSVILIKLLDSVPADIGLTKTVQ